MRLGILTSHPIQYQAPWFRALAKDSDLEVFFAHRQSANEQGKAGFGVAFDWDVDLLSGYRHRFLKNISPNPGVNHFSGCDSPGICEIISQNADNRSPLTRPSATLSPSDGERAGRGAFDAFIVSGWHLRSYRQAVRACRRTRVPVLVRGDSQLRTPRSTLKRLAMEVRQRWLLRQFDGFLTVGKRNREYLEHYGVPEKKIFFAPHFVDNQWFARKAAEVRVRRSEVRSQWGARECDLVALFVGKFIPKKRPADLLRALVKLREPLTLALSPSDGERVAKLGEGAGLLAVFVGSGELETELRKIAARENVRAHFAGFKNQTELPACYAAADMLVLPSDGGETWGLVVNEAMACGLPAIVSDAVGCAPDLIEEGKTGFTFPLGDAYALAERLAELGKLKQAGHDFGAALAAKLETYSVASAVAGTLAAAHAVVRAES